MTSSRRFRVLVLPLVVLTALALPSLAAAAPHLKVFSATGAEQPWTVPSGVTSIAVEAIGAGGGDGPLGGGQGGLGAVVKGTLAVTPGETLYVEVGTTGAGATPSFNGGGTTLNAGFGGGASDVRTVARSEGGLSLASRRLIAAGGGGGGGEAGGKGGNVAESGANGTDVGVSAQAGLLGGGASAIGGGKGGDGGSGTVVSGSPGGDGILGEGGAGVGNVNGGGGGGGGGLYGGGAGGTGGRNSSGNNAGGGGGGGGSNLVPAGGSEELALRGEAGKVRFTYTVDPGVQVGGSSALSAESALLLGSITGYGDEVSAFFEYGPTSAYGTASTPTFPTTQNVSPSIVVSGLTPGSTYHYRLVATTSSGGRSATPDATFTTPALPATETPVTTITLTSPTVPLGPGPVVTCKVPKLTGKKLPAAKKALAAADCKLGKVTKRKGPAKSKGKVVKQGKKPGTVLADGTAVTVVVGR
jgi:hypothetical protein